MNQLELFPSEGGYSPVPVTPQPLTGTALGRARIQEVINKGKSRASRVITYVKNNRPTDRIVRGTTLQFEVNDDRKVGLFLPGQRVELRMHRHALGQMLKYANMPIRFAEFLEAQGNEHDPWGAEHVAGILTDVYQKNQGDKKFLMRDVSGQVRGFLSDRYKRYDTEMIIDSFAGACQQVGAVPYEGYVSDTKIGIQAISPTVYEPVPGEIMAYGCSMEHSDYGDGTLEFLFFILRLVCLNGMIGQQALRKIHKGSQLGDDIAYSQKTYELDSATMASAINDLVLSHLSTERIELGQQVIQMAAAQTLDGVTRSHINEILKAGLSKEQIEKINTKFNEPDVELLPPGNTVWRMANAVSWLAGQEEDEHEKLNIQHLAGQLLPKAA